MRIILASKSPRRRELLSAIYDNFEIISLEVDETLPYGMHPYDGVRALAERKGREVALAEGEDALIISSDTLVELDGLALGKPNGREEAKKMLHSLSGRAHNVHTGVAVHYRGRMLSATASTAVYFKELSEDEIDEYISTGEEVLKTKGVIWDTHNGNQPEWYDKAGAYAIQGMAGRFVSHYDGDFDTVVGLSLKLVKALVEEICDE